MCLEDPYVGTYMDSELNYSNAGADQKGQTVEAITHTEVPI